MPDGWHTERVTGPAEKGGAGAYCDLIKHGDHIVEIVEYDHDGRVMMRVYGTPPPEVIPTDPADPPAPVAGDVPAPGE